MYEDNKSEKVDGSKVGIPSKARGSIDKVNRSILLDCRKTTKSSNSEKTDQIKKMITSSDGIAQLAASSIKYNATAFEMSDGKKEVVGSSMIANINPAEEMKGSSPGKGVQARLMQDFKNQGYKRMVRGHLMNGQLGGLGIAANLFPITSQANSKHKNHVENPIKNQVKEGKEIQYTVAVNSANNISDPRAEFDCHAQERGGPWRLREKITSVPGRTQSRGDNVEGHINNDSPSMSFRSANLPRGFGESGNGYSERSADHQRSIDKSSFSWDGQDVDVNNLIYARGIHYNSGAVEQESFANELLTKYNGDPDNIWPIYFNGNAYNSDALQAEIDKPDILTLNEIIDKLERLLDE